MTIIRDPAIPNVEGEVRKDEFHKLDKVMTGRRLVVVLGVSALVLTAVNLAASAYLLGAVSELRSIDQRLQDLAGLEKRLKASIEVVNTGIQTQVETLNRDMHDKVTELEDGVGRIQQNLDQPRMAAELPESPPSADAVPVAEPQTEPDIEAADAAQPSTDMPLAAIEQPKPRKPKPPPISKVGSAYQRTEMPDGKVYYRRVQ